MNHYNYNQYNYQPSAYQPLYNYPHEGNGSTHPYGHVHPEPEPYSYSLSQEQPSSSFMQTMKAGFQQSLAQPMSSAVSTPCNRQFTIDHPNSFSVPFSGGTEYSNSYFPDDPETPQPSFQKPSQGKSTGGRNRTIHTQEARREHNNKAVKKYLKQKAEKNIGHAKENESLKKEYAKLMAIHLWETGTINHSNSYHSYYFPYSGGTEYSNSHVPDDPETLQPYSQEPSQENSDEELKRCRSPVTTLEEKRKRNKEAAARYRAKIKGFIDNLIKENDNLKKKIEALKASLKINDEQMRSFFKDLPRGSHSEEGRDLLHRPSEFVNPFYP